MPTLDNLKVQNPRLKLIEFFPDDPVVPVCDCVLDVVRGRVDKDARIVPRPRLDPGVLVDRTELLELPVGDRCGQMNEKCRHFLANWHQIEVFRFTLR